MTLALLVGALVAVWTALAALAAYWIYTDAREAAQVRRHEAEMAAAGTRAHRTHQDLGRYGDPNRPE